MQLVENTTVVFSIVFLNGEVMQASVLVERFGDALSSEGKMRSWKRSLTMYCTQRERETGTSANRFRAAVKAMLRKAKYTQTTIKTHLS